MSSKDLPRLVWCATLLNIHVTLLSRKAASCSLLVVITQYRFTHVMSAGLLKNIISILSLDALFAIQSKVFVELKR